MEPTKILVVSECSTFRKNIRGLLDSSLYSVEVISYDELAPIAILNSSPDAVLLDHEGRLDVACKALKLIQNYTGAPVIVIMDDRNAENTYRELDGMRADGFLVKPLMQVLLEGYIRAKLRRILQFNEKPYNKFAIV